ncbi:MAG: hypothetical protein ACREA0_05895, partial [bacterium]
MPILSLPGRNGLDLNLALFYNSRLWTIDKANSTATFNADRDFPSYGFRLGFGYIENENNTFLLTEPDGSKRAFRYVSGSTWETSDSSYIDYNSSTKILRRKDGAQWEYEQVTGATLYRPKKIKDTNGNFISITYVSGDDQEINTITDTLGRVVTFNYDANGKLTSISQGSVTHFTLNWGTTLLQYNFASTLSVVDSPADDSSISVLTGCRYPNSTGYDFVYGDWGIIKEIKQVSSNGTTRSSVAYNYPTVTQGTLSDHPTFSVQSVFDGAATTEWDYSVTKTGGLVSAFQVTDPSGANTITNLHTSTWKTGLPDTVVIKDSSNNELRTMAYSWTQESTQANNPRILSVTTTLDDSNDQQSRVDFTYTTYGNVSQVKEYDYGPLLRRITDITYNTNSNYTSRHILDRPTQVKVSESGAALKSRTDFAYDSTPLTSVSGASSHDDTNYGSGFTYRGNLSAITRYSNAAGGSGQVTRNFTYDSLGNLIKADLDCCQLKQWAFTSATQYAYPTTITTGPAAGPQLAVTRAYDFATGLLLTATDENNKQTSFAYDTMNRLTTVTRPDSVQLTSSFDDAALSPKVTSTTPIDATNSLVQILTADGLGRPLKQETKSGGGVTYSIADTAYDTSGRPTQTSNPYTGGTVLWTTYQYDALSRVSSVTPPGSQGSYTYAYDCPSDAPGTAVRVTDPAGKDRCTYTDALGRLVRVDEPGFEGGTAGSGSVTISGSPQSIELPEGCDDIYEP